MNILPPMATVWYHLARKHLGNDIDITIFDCSGSLRPKEFSGARVQKFLNRYASTKSEEFLRHIARNKRIGWISDDDMFFVAPGAREIVERELAVPNTASVSFRPRTWWEYNIDGVRHPVSSSYNIAFNREILFEKENLCLDPCNGNTHPGLKGKNPSRYDTCDKANEILLEKEYRCHIVSPEEQEKYVTGFSSMSGAVMLLWYFRTPEQMQDYLLSPEKKAWQGNILYEVFGALLAITTIQELHEKITGTVYPLRSLPSKETLEKIRKEHEPLLRDGNSWSWVDEVSEKLRKAI